jgi:acyl-CoA thioester hydrolase
VTTEHELEIRVYLEDTDAQGIVYHANYLRYFERARSEILASVGATAVDFGSDRLRFVVHEVRIKYARPATLGDSLTVRTRVELGSPFRLTYHHDVHRRGEPKPTASGVVEVVCITPAGGLVEFPAELLDSLGLG